MDNEIKTKSIGETGEEISANFLKKHGYTILAMNFQNNSGRRLGEIDIIARDSETSEIVFVEVKSRDIKKYAHTLPEENINPQKLRKLSKIAYYYLRERTNLDAPHRFDALSVWIDTDLKNAKIKHLKNIFF
ncbi:MAG: YraN family protein [Candidatus Moranbacteria bacterium CG10_big_fil_rev_8_21_14_0_10_35_21]|nr:MAG: YraN family protein [Candidatus Moranbacteria bacterium CG10_big_fil_rev_8_21_14_0_10_35_21]PJA88654.1 MAG: YraN family protein [Candidatus Moranbacteria bacterium CG_4_9_14_3_um_filter_36_9]